MKEFLLDANVLVRFLVQDDPKQSAGATALFEKAERREVLLHLDALAVAESVLPVSSVRVTFAPQPRETAWP
ncbi:MAG TPA: hypothetical protein VN281_08115 [Verrucomicrobiae bacterium]|nr:hypothetical protein [Verrucomicrobiae bacterium]